MPGENYGLVLERGPFGFYEDSTHMEPGGISRTLKTEDIDGAQPPPYIPGFVPPAPDSKWYPEPWMGLSVEEKKKKPSRQMATSRCTNPLTPAYKLPTGPSILPSAPDWVFSKRVTDGLDTADIPGARAEKLYAKPVRPYPKTLEPDPNYAVLHSTGHIHERHTPAWEPQQEGPLNISDVDIGKKRHGFRRRIEANPVDPVYHPLRPEFARERFDRLKRKVIQPRLRPRPVLDKLLQKVYWKSEQLPKYFSQYDPNLTDRISYDRFRKGLREFGVEYNDTDFNTLLNYVDKDHSGTVHYLELAKNCRHVDGFELPIPRRLGEEIGHPVELTCIGQGQHVLEVVKPRGRGIVKRPSDATPYETFTGIPFDPNMEYKAEMTREAESKYSYGEFSATLFNEDKAKLPTFTTTDMPSGYEPPDYFPPAAMPVEESFQSHQQMQGASIPSMPEEGSIPVTVVPKQSVPTPLPTASVAPTSQQPVPIPSAGKQPSGLLIPQQISPQEIPRPLPKTQSVVWNEIVSAQLAQIDNRAEKRPSVMAIPLAAPADVPLNTTVRRSSKEERMLRLPRLGRESESRFQAAVWRPQKLTHSVRPSFYNAQTFDVRRNMEIDMVRNLRDEPPVLAKAEPLPLPPSLPPPAPPGKGGGKGGRGK